MYSTISLNHNLLKMKATKLRKKITYFPLFLLLIIPLFFSCDPESTSRNTPKFISAEVNNGSKNTVNVTFTERIYTDEDGFTIWVDDTKAEISEVEGSGSRIIDFILKKDIKFGQEVYIEYDASAGNAEDEDGVNLNSFSKKDVANNVDRQTLAVYLPTIPPDMKNDSERVWLVLKTDEDANKWATVHTTARVNESLSVLPTKTPFDLIVYITADDEWRPNMAFGTGYYATVLNLNSDDIQYKVISWQNSDDLKGINMGHLLDIDNNEENYNFENAYVLSTEGNDYLESYISRTDTLWYKFSADLNSSYTVYLYDYYTDSYNYSGSVDGILKDKYQIALSNATVVESGHPITIQGTNEYIYIEVKVAERGGQPGNFQIQVIKN